MTNRPIKVLYIAGWQRSGSTILANLLGQLEGFVSTGELYYLWDYVWTRNILCGCGTPFHACPFWSEVVRRAYGAPEKIDAAAMLRAARHIGRTRAFPSLALPGSRRRLAVELEDYLAGLQRLYGAIAATTRGAVIVDSSKWPSYGLALGLLPDVDLRVVHLVRDPRAVAHSWLRRKALPDRFPPEEMYRRPVASALRWNTWNLATEAFWGRDVVRLRYEDFMRAPLASVERILAFAGEAPRRLPFVSERTIELGPTHTVSGNPLRLRSGRVELREDDEWRTQLAPRTKVLVSLLTLPLLLRYGYLGQAGREPVRVGVPLRE